jgi:hypothetical protein
MMKRRAAMLAENRTVSAFMVALALAEMLAATLTMGARQDKPGEQSSAAVAARPGAAEMERLKSYVGEWDYTETYPRAGKNTGVYTSKLAPGGSSLINTFHSTGPVGDFEGLLILTWDTNEKAYQAYAFGNEFPGAIVETGQFEGDALV